MKEGWEYKKLKEVGCTQTGTTPSKSVKSFYGGEIPFIRPAELDIDGNGSIEYNSELKLTSEGASKSRIIKANSTLMCCIGSVGKTGYAIKDVTCNQQINTITPYDGYNGKFIYYALLTPSFQKEVIKIANSAKATLAIISKGKWEEMFISVPPLSEQQCIVDYLDSAFAKIEEMKANAEKALNEAKALFQASLNKMFEPKEGWEEKKIKEIGTVIGGTTPNTNVSEYWNGTLCWISPAELNGSHYLYDSKYKITEAAVKAKNLKLLPEGTVILSSRAPIGKVVINKIPTYCNQGFKCVICGENIYNEFLYWWFWGKTKYLNSLGTGATFKEISKKIVEEITIPVPPFSEQKTIADYLENLKSKVDHLQENYDKISKECDAMKQAILRQVFE